MTALLEAEDLRRHFAARGRQRGGTVRAVDGLSLRVEAGQTVSVVGESGCGKSTLGRMILGVDEPTGGTLRWQGRELSTLRGEDRRAFRRSVQAVFQDPWSSLNPRRRIGAILTDPLLANRLDDRAAAEQRAVDALSEVGLPAESLRKYPHQFSGGQRQRIAVARALIMRPSLVVLDEPASSLDVSIQAQVLNLLRDVQREHGLAYVLISHNLATVRFMSDRVAVMYLGRIVEEGPTAAVFDRPAHPYTRALISASLPVDPTAQREEIVLEGEVPSPIDPPSGCRFHTRCPMVLPICAEVDPAWRGLGDDDHAAACHLHDGPDAEGVPVRLGENVGER